jgi:hypothetical protein
MNKDRRTDDGPATDTFLKIRDKFLLNFSWSNEISSVRRRACPIGYSTTTSFNFVLSLNTTISGVVKWALFIDDSNAGFMSTYRNTPNAIRGVTRASHHFIDCHCGFNSCETTAVEATLTKTTWSIPILL